MPTSSSVDAFARNPPAYLPAGDATVVDDPRFFLKLSRDGTRATACRLAGNTGEIWEAVMQHAPAARVTWITDGSQEEELRALGCREQDAPITSYITALATEAAPPPVEGVEIRKIASGEDDTLAQDVFARGWGVPRPPVGSATQWVAFIDGEPVAFAAAVAGPVGLFLTGGVTVSEARSRGAYRALVRARWDEAVALGTPALVVHAEDGARRVLERIGFKRVADIVELVYVP